jgi:hypothetical protein
MASFAEPTQSTDADPDTAASLGPAPVAAHAATAAGEGLGGLAQEPGYGYGIEDDPLYDPSVWSSPLLHPGPVRTTLIRDRGEERRAALRERFKIGTGEKGPNAVSEEEFGQIFSMYEHIREGDRNLVIETKGMGDDADTYQNNVMEQISRLLQTPTGRKELEYLTYGYKDANGAHKDFHTSIQAGADLNGNGSRLDDYAAETPAVDNDGADLHFDLNGKLLGRGGGSDSVVNFNVPAWAEKDGRADVVLAHELTHSLTQILGIQDATPVDFSDGVPKDVSGQKPLDRAEHQATGLGKYKAGPASWLPVNERHYVEDRKAVSGVGEVAGDHELKARESYRK